MDLLNLRNVGYFRKNYLYQAMVSGYVEMTHPETPKSKNQKYRLTTKGLELKPTLEQTP